MSNLTIVGTNDYETLVEQSNLKIQNFISNHPECIKYEPNIENGFVFITLNFGKVHSEDLKAISEMCMNSLIDAVFTIGDLPASVVYSNDSLIKFKGKQTEVEEKIISTTVLPEVAKTVLKEKSKADVVIPTDFISKIHRFLKTYEDGRNSNSEFRTLTEKIGITYKPYAGKGHISLDLQKLADVNTSTINHSKPIDSKTFIETVKYVCKTFNMLIKEKPSLVTGDLIKILDKNEIVLESISKSVAQFAYGNIPEEPVTSLPSESEVSYKKTPGSITRVRLVYVTENNTEIDSELVTLETPITSETTMSDLYVQISSAVKTGFLNPSRYLSNFSSNAGSPISGIDTIECDYAYEAVFSHVNIRDDDNNANNKNGQYWSLYELANNSMISRNDEFIVTAIAEGNTLKVIIPYPTTSSGSGYHDYVRYLLTDANLN